ncbi:MAG: hypothetical protein RLZZ234_111 [Candidatus Parcubacteria bacterium]|jgi:hypothetical protein
MPHGWIDDDFDDVEEEPVTPSLTLLRGINGNILLTQ